MKRKTIIHTAVMLLMLGSFTACEDMLGVSSSSVQYEDTHELNSAADSLYSVVGILNKMQSIADRTVLLGELRGDLVTDNENTEKDLRELINHEVSPTNVYVNYRDYYTVINNCNYFLAKVDTNVIVSNKKVMLKEVAAVKAMRAWTYLQLALIYESVPFITEPILTLEDAERWDEECEYMNHLDMCDYFINDLLPFVDQELPSYGTIDSYESKKFLFPVALLLGDMYLWKQDYENAYKYYAHYAYKEKLLTWHHGIMDAGFSALTNDIAGIGWRISSKEHITVIRMASSKLHGVTSNLENIFSPTDINEGKRAVSPSRLWKELAEKQTYAYQTSAGGTTVRYLTCGDLRAVGTYYTEWSDGSFRPSYGSSSDAWYQVDVDNLYLENWKYGKNAMLLDENTISIYRTSTVFLRMAEALNRMGEPAKAFAILKDGVTSVLNTSTGYVLEIAEPNNENGAVGIHSRGSGASHFNDKYDVDYSEFDFTVTPDSVDNRLIYVYQVTDQEAVLVDSIVQFNTYYGVDGMPSTCSTFGEYEGLITMSDSTYTKGTGLGSNKTPDTIRCVYVPTAYLVDKVEEMIVDEMALETAFEGHRFYDLMRVAIRRNDNAFLANKVAHRNGEEGEFNATLWTKLLNRDNWYISRNDK